MIPVSARYSTPLCLLLLPVVALAVFQRNFRSPSDECADPAAFYETQRVQGTLDARELWERHDDFRMQWSEGLIDVGVPEIAPLRYRIIRSHNPKPLYRLPTDFLRDEIERDWGEIQQVRAGEIDLPVHKVYGHSETEILLGAYLFVYGSRPVASPYLTQLREVVPQLLSGGRPLMLIAVSGSMRGDRFEAADRAATEWIARVWQHFDSVCSP